MPNPALGRLDVSSVDSIAGRWRISSTFPVLHFSYSRCSNIRSGKIMQRIEIVPGDLSFSEAKTYTALHLCPVLFFILLWWQAHNPPRVFVFCPCCTWCGPQVDIGDTLTEFKSFTGEFPPDMKVIKGKRVYRSGSVKKKKKLLNKKLRLNFFFSNFRNFLCESVLNWWPHTKSYISGGR